MNSRDKIPENTDLENLGNDYHFARHRRTMLSAVSRKLIVATLMAVIMMFPGCIGADEESDEGLGALPDFQGVADNGETFSKSSVTGGDVGFIIVFSAEWCNAPCHQVMHKLHNSLDNPTVLVMSTDPNTDITLQEWHEDADDFDDEGNDTGVDLPFYFMKGVEIAEELEISARPTLMFVNADGIIMHKHEGAVNSDDSLVDMYAKIS